MTKDQIDEAMSPDWMKSPCRVQIGPGITEFLIRLSVERTRPKD